MSEPAKRLTVLEGRHLPDIDTASVCYWKDPGSGHWYIYLPGVGSGVLSQHGIEEHADGTITATPSIKLTGGQGRERHGWLRRGEWTEA